MTDQPKGMQLCENFYTACVAPLLHAHFPQVTYSAARLGSGSDVLGFDDHRSPDHDWGPQVDLFFTEDDYTHYGAEIYRRLSEELPVTFQGYSTHFRDDYLMEPVTGPPIIHRARSHSIRSFFTNYIGFNPASEISEIDWLRTPEQKLRTIQAGKVFHDGLNRLRAIQKKLAWYPNDLWYYLLACQWRRIDQEEPFVARCGDVGDNLGSKIVAARLVKDIIQLCFYMERAFAPYSKWFGTAFRHLKSAERLLPLLNSVLVKEHWREREALLSEVYLLLANMHNNLGITEFIEPKIVNFHNRPYKVPQSERFVTALLNKVESQIIRQLQRPIGSISQFTDSTDISCWNAKLHTIATVYDE